jgi:hypothetical protein
MINGTKTVVTSIYELNYENLRGGGVYKNFQLLTETIQALIFDEYNYVIYTDKNTYDKHNLNDFFNHSNITIKFQELNSEFYTTKINPIREDKFSKGEIYDRIYSVSNYMEVILNKLKHIVDESKLAGEGDSIIWLDSGLFGTSCHNAWRDYIKTIVYDKFFLDKIFEKIDDYGFITTKGNDILINYEVKGKVVDIAGSDVSIIPGCLFGGKVTNNLKILSNYENIYLEYITKYQELISEQEVLSILTNNKDVKFFEFGDWLDLQKAFLQILDLYDEKKYKIDSILGYQTNTNLDEINEDDITFNSFTELSDKLGIDKGSIHENHMYSEVYERMLSKYINGKPVIIEIGINDTRFPGGCLKFWDLIFPSMEYYGYDIIDCSHLKCNKEKITTVIGDQNSPEDLMKMIDTYQLSGKIDFIIDDGSHISEHIITSFKTLYPHIKKGGIYFIEDLHAGYAKKDYTISVINSIIDEYGFEVTSKELTNNDKLWVITK